MSYLPGVYIRWMDGVTISWHLAHADVSQLTVIELNGKGRPKRRKQGQRSAIPPWLLGNNAKKLRFEHCVECRDEIAVGGNVSEAIGCLSWGFVDGNHNTEAFGSYPFGLSQNTSQSPHRSPAKPHFKKEWLNWKDRKNWSDHLNSCLRTLFTFSI